MVKHTEVSDPGRGNERRLSGSFWSSAAGKTTIAALAAGALMLGYEYRATVFAGGLAIWLPLLLCVGMHAFMHSGHHRHGHRSAERSARSDQIDETTNWKETE